MQGLLVMYPLESLNFIFFVSKDKEKGGLWVAGNFSKPERQRDRETHRLRERERETDRQADRQTHRQTDRQTDIENKR